MGPKKFASIKESVAMVVEIIYDEIDIDVVIIYLSAHNFGVMIKTKYGGDIGCSQWLREGRQGQ